MNKPKFCAFTDEECIFEEGKGNCNTCSYNYTRNENTCICCGEVIPEGRQVCINCENKTKTTKTIDASKIVAGKTYNAKACIVDGELKCAASIEICKDCEYKDVFKCQDATLIIKGDVANESR